MAAGCHRDMAKGATKRCCYDWALTSLQRNKLQHALCGNGAGGSRTTARKRKESEVRADPVAGFDLSQLAPLLMLLQQVLALVNSGSFDLQDVLQKLGAVMNGSSKKGGTNTPTKKRRKKRKSKRVLAPPSHAVQPFSERTFADSKQQLDKAAPSKPDKGSTDPHPAGRTFAQVAGAAGEKQVFQPVWQLRPSDWDASILSIDEITHRICEKSPAKLQAVSFVQNDSELDELRTLLSGFEDASHELGITAIMLATKGDTPKQDGEIIQVPGKRQGKVTPRMAHVVKLGSNCPSLKRTIRRIESTPEMVKTVVLRLATEARYHDESKWKAILEHSSHAAHKWLHSNLPAVMQRKVRDTWGWQLESSKGGGKALVTAMVRVEHTAVNSMLSLSGKESWFIEPLRWDQPDVPACEVKWVKRNPEEPGPQYANRVHAEAGNLGVARGWKSLGVRVPRGSETRSKTRTKTWRVTGVPSDWSHEPVFAELQAAGLSNLQLTSRKSYGRKATLFLTASCENDVDFVEIRFEGSPMIATAFNPAKHHRSERKPLKSGSGLSFAPDAFPSETDTHGKSVRTSFYVASPVKKKQKVEEVAETQLDASQPDSSMDTREPAEATSPREGAAGKRAAGSPNKGDDCAPRSKVLKRPVPSGMSRVKNAGQGNCLFEAIGQALSPNKPKHGRTVRAAIVTHLRRHSDRYQPWWDALGPDGKSCDSFDAYLKLLNKPGAWAGCLEIAAAAAHYDKAIYVFGPVLQSHVEGYHTSCANGYLSLWYEDNHYEWLKGPVPDDVRKNVCNGPLQGGRGGATSSKVSTSASGRTRSSALPPPPSFGGRTRKSALPDLPVPSVLSAQRNTQVSAKSVSSSRCLDEVDLADRDDMPDPPPVTSARDKNQPQDWVCPECGFRTGLHKNWNKIRRNHVVTWHAEKKNFYNRHRVADLIPWDPDLCSWKCPLCASGVPKTVSDVDVHYRMRLAHRDRCHPRAKRQRFVRARGSSANARKATIAKTAAGLARRMVDLKAGEQGEHDCEILQLPHVGKGKAVRRFHNKLFCKKCKALASSVKKLSSVRCDASFKGGPKRKQLIASLQKFADKLSVGSQEHTATLQVVSKISPPANVDELVPRAHNVVQVQTPGKRKQAALFCTRCRRLSATKKHLNKFNCSSAAVWSPARERVLRQVDENAKGAKGKRLKALSELTDLLTGKATSSSTP